jgi:heme-degrading monooxygenase HmoA
VWNWFFSLHRYRNKSRVEVTDEGVIFGGRLVRWGDVEDVKAWSESFREAEVESSGVETVYFSRQEYRPFVKAVSGILGKRGVVPEWLQELEK